jgi:hypothetical protein
MCATSDAVKYVAAARRFAREVPACRDGATELRIHVLAARGNKRPLRIAIEPAKTRRPIDLGVNADRWSLKARRVEAGLRPQSRLSASMGCTLAARRAGIQLAPNATVSKRRTAPHRVAGS